MEKSVFKVGQKVKTIKTHGYLRLTKRSVGTVVRVEDDEVEVRFRNRIGAIIFIASELRGMK